MDFSENILEGEGDNEAQFNLGGNGLQKEDNTEENKFDTNSNTSGSDDQYLQIDISEEKDNLFFDVGLLETIDGEKEEDKKDKNREKTTEEGISSRNEISTEKNYLKNLVSTQESKIIENNDIFDNGNTIERTQQMSYRKSCKRRKKFRPKTTNCIGFNLSERFFRTGSNVGTHLNFYNSEQGVPNPILNFFQPTFNPLSFPDSGRNTFYNYLPNNRSYQARIFSKNGTFNRFQNINSEIIENRFHARESCRGFESRKHNHLELVTPEKKAFEEYEKKTEQLKKKARLKRFMSDESIIKKKNPLNTFIKIVEKPKSPSEASSRVGCQKKENFENEQQSLLEVKPKPEINKESLLKKKNPFEGQSETSIPNPRIKIKEENGKRAVKESKDRCFYVVKNDAESCVKFVLSAPKRFSELPLKSQNWPLEDENSIFSNSHKSLSSLKATNVISSNKNVAQIVSQLTGCIVKVFNIPPTTTANDILTLCQPIGMVMEVKVNFPKENSVVIRFAESSSAEKFYSMYHGQKLNNYFLNVIVV